MEVNMQQHMDKLRELLGDLRAGNIHAIEFGDKNYPLGAMSHHRILIIPTLAGAQFCFKRISRGMTGSGDYIGQPTDREIEIKAQAMLEKYYAPGPLAHLVKNKKDLLEYFAIEHER